MADPQITDSQRRIGTLLALGLSAKEAGDQLGIAQGTVEAHRAMLYRSLGIRDITALVKYALAKGWVHNPYQRGRPRRSRA